MVTSIVEKRKGSISKVRDIRDTKVRGDGQFVAVSRVVWTGLMEKVDLSKDREYVKEK